MLRIAKKRDKSSKDIYQTKLINDKLTHHELYSHLNMFKEIVFRYRVEGFNRLIYNRPML